MFIAHLPGGYLLSRLHPRLRQQKVWTMTGAILPDLDLLWFYFVDGAVTHHHTYLTHRPILWAMMMMLGVLLRTRGAQLWAVGIGGLLHLALDSMAGAIAWGWPLWKGAHPLVVVPATDDWWVLSFLTHWSFAVEVMIVATAIVVFRSEHARGR